MDGTIFGVNLGGTLSIDEGSPTQRKHTLWITINNRKRRTFWIRLDKQR